MGDKLDSPGLTRVQEQLRLYEHPLLRFEARARGEGEGVEVIISLREMQPGIQAYHFQLHPRDLENPSFEWHFQRQLYDCLHDYLIEMFHRTPQDRKERFAERPGKAGPDPDPGRKPGLR